MKRIWWLNLLDFLYQERMKILRHWWRSHSYGPTAATLWGLLVLEWSSRGCECHSREPEMSTIAHLLPPPPCKNSETLPSKSWLIPCPTHKFCIDSRSLNYRTSITSNWCHKWMMYQVHSCNCPQLKHPWIWEALSGQVQATQIRRYTCHRHLQDPSQFKEWWVEP